MPWPAVRDLYREVGGGVTPYEVNIGFQEPGPTVTIPDLTDVADLSDQQDCFPSFGWAIRTHFLVMTTEFALSHPGDGTKASPLTPTRLKLCTLLADPIRHPYQQ